MLAPQPAGIAHPLHLAPGGAHRHLLAGQLGPLHGVVAHPEGGALREQAGREGLHVDRGSGLLFDEFLLIETTKSG